MSSPIPFLRPVRYHEFLNTAQKAKHILLNQHRSEKLEIFTSISMYRKNFCNRKIRRILQMKSSTKIDGIFRGPVRS